MLRPEIESANTPPARPCRARSQTLKVVLLYCCFKASFVKFPLKQLNKQPNKLLNLLPHLHLSAGHAAEPLMSFCSILQGKYGGWFCCAYVCVETQPHLLPFWPIYFDSTPPMVSLSLSLSLTSSLIPTPEANQMLISVAEKHTARYYYC